MGKEKSKDAELALFSPSAQISINLALTTLSIALALATVWLMHKSNMAMKISTYSDHQPMLAMDNDEGLVIDHVKLPASKELDTMDAELHFSIKNLGSGIAHNVNYAVLNFLDRHEVGSVNLSRADGGGLLRVDSSILPGGSVRINYADKSFLFEEMLQRNNNETDCIAITITYEQRNLDGSVMPQHYFVRLRPYWTDKRTKKIGMLILEQRYTESMPFGLKLSGRRQNNFEPILHESAGEAQPKFHITRAR